MVDENTQKSVWNFDGAELYVIFQIKSSYIEFLQNWELENAYWSARDLRRELDAKLSRKKERFEGIGLENESNNKNKKGKEKSKSEKQLVDEELKKLGESREEFSKKNNPSDKEKGEYYQKLEEFYMFLCHLMKKHGLYFREGEDSTMAVLRR